jgi:hypothetical protein
MVNNTALAGALLQADVPLVADDVCAAAMGTVDPKTQVCAGYTNGGVDGCQGDRCERRESGMIVQSARELLGVSVLNWASQ